MMSCHGVYRPFPFLHLQKIESQKLPCCSISRRRSRSQFLQRKRFPLGFSSGESVRKFIHIAASAASSPSFSGSSGADVSEQLLGAETKRKRPRIAGIDQDELLDPANLADPDSLFCEFKGVQIHHKLCDAEPSPHKLSDDGNISQVPEETNKIGFPMILLHGFGASVFSWDRVMKPLARAVCSKVLAFDRPAFGLTSRVNPFDRPSSGSEDTKPLNPYSTMFSVMATLYFIGFLVAEKAILVGHSAGSLVAVQTYFEAPERIAAIILVAPAIIAPLMKQKVVKKTQTKRDEPIKEDNAAEGNSLMRLFTSLSRFAKYVLQAIIGLAKGMVDMLNSLYTKALSALLRSAIGAMLVRMVIDKFGIAAVRNSWYDAKQVTDHVLRSYTKPLRVKGWDKALVEYTVALLTDPLSERKPPLTERLNEISCPVLIITGDNDRLVPPWNSKRLSQAIPGASLEVIKNCGHLPPEEKPEEFVSIVEKFLHRVFGGSESQILQVAT